MQELIRKYNGSIYYVFKPFPLPNHDYSFNIARAVLCASRQGREVEMRNQVFAQPEICAANDEAEIKQIAFQSGLNVAEFSRCYDNNETGAELERYVEQGKAAHIYATPTFFVNGKPLVGPRPVEEFERLIGS